MQNFSNFLNQIENKRPCHGFANNQHAAVGSTTKQLQHNDNNIDINDNNLTSTYANSSSNLTNSNGLYALQTIIY